MEGRGPRPEEHLQQTLGQWGLGWQSNQSALSWTAERSKTGLEWPYPRPLQFSSTSLFMTIRQIRGASVQRPACQRRISQRLARYDFLRRQFYQ